MSDEPKADPTASLRRVRWAQAIAFGIVGIALVATAVQSLVGAQRSAETLTIGQGQRLLEAVQRAHRTFGPEIDQHAAQILARHEEFGLRCIGLFRRDHVRRIGECVLSEAAMLEVLADTASDRPITVADHVAMISDPSRGPGPPGGRPPKGAEFGGGPPAGAGFRGGPGRPPQDGRPPDGRGREGFGQFGPPGDPYSDERPGPPRGGRGGPRGLPPVLIEFEPIEAEALEASLTTSAIVAFIAVAALLLGGLALFRLTRRAERLQEEAELDRRLVTLGEMASVLAHEIRNPLAALKGHAQLLAEQLPEDGREKRSADRVVRSAVRLESLTEDLLSLVRSNRVERREIEPRAVLRDSLAQVRFDRFEVTTSRAPAQWRLDSERMQQVLVNLLQNAADASPEGRPAEIAIFERDHALVFQVRDQGDGIPAGEEERIFDPFFTKRTQGTGLGLAVARRIVELHGGTITARNLDSGGAEFEVVIP